MKLCMEVQIPHSDPETYFAVPTGINWNDVLKIAEEVQRLGVVGGNGDYQDHFRVKIDGTDRQFLVERIDSKDFGDVSISSIQQVPISAINLRNGETVSLLAKRGFIDAFGGMQRSTPWQIELYETGHPVRVDSFDGNYTIIHSGDRLQADQNNQLP